MTVSVTQTTRTARQSQLTRHAARFRTQAGMGRCSRGDSRTRRLQRRSAAIDANCIRRAAIPGHFAACRSAGGWTRATTTRLARCALAAPAPRHVCALAASPLALCHFCRPHDWSQCWLRRLRDVDAPSSFRQRGKYTDQWLTQHRRARPGCVRHEPWTCSPTHVPCESAQLDVVPPAHSHLAMHSHRLTP